MGASWPPRFLQKPAVLGSFLSFSQLHERRSYRLDWNHTVATAATTPFRPFRPSILLASAQSLEAPTRKRHGMPESMRCHSNPYGSTKSCEKLMCGDTFAYLGARRVQSYLLRSELWNFVPGRKLLMPQNLNL